MGKPLKQGWVLIAIWSVPVVVMMLQWLVQALVPRVQVLISASPLGLLTDTVIQFLLWALATPAILALARTFRLTTENWWKLGPLHIVTGMLAAFVHKCLHFLLISRYFITGHTGDSLIDVMLSVAADSLLSGSIIYWAILVAGHLINYYERLRTTEQRAAGLNESLLRAQLTNARISMQPHFLFNSLNSVQYLASRGRQADLETLIDRLSAFLRNALEHTDDQCITVEQELALLRDYLAIEEIRYADRLSVSWQIESRVLPLRMPCYLLQPLAENAIKHGVSRRLEAGRLTVSAFQDADTLVLRIRDDGPGPQHSPLPPEYYGQGLTNTVERLSLLLHDAGSFSLTRAGDSGAVAELRLPVSAASATAEALN